MSRWVNGNDGVCVMEDYERCTSIVNGFPMTVIYIGGARLCKANQQGLGAGWREYSTVPLNLPGCRLTCTMLVVAERCSSNAIKASPCVYYTFEVANLGDRQ